MKIYTRKGEEILVSPEDYDYLSQFTWRTDKDGYVVRSLLKGEKRYPGNVFMHREILNAPKGLVTDHKNHDPLDNRRENIRLCTQAQNLMNSSNRPGSSKYKGVHWHNGGRKWAATLQHQEKRIHIGLFEKEREAAKAYNKKASELCGEFASLNLI